MSSVIKSGDVYFESPLAEWFELSYAQFLTVPRLVLESMPYEWQQKMSALLQEMDATFDWRPAQGRYWVRLKDDQGHFSHAPLNDYRHGNIEHLRIKTAAAIDALADVTAREYGGEDEGEAE